MLLQRMLTALIGIPTAVYIIQTGGWLFSLTIILLALIAWREYHRMLKNKTIHTGITGGIITTLVILLCAWCGNFEEVMLVLWISLLWSLLYTLKIWKSGTMPFEAAAFTFFGIAYIGFTFMHLILLRQMDASVLTATIFGELSLGTIYIWVAFLGTWASDTFAYFIGTAFGRHKLAPSISPHKSIEGVVGGLIGSVFAVAVFGHFTAIPFIHRLAAGFLIGLIAPVGDLAESALKRFCSVKDSGTLLPGHGGILDRFDSILFSVPAVYYYVRFIVLQ